MRRRVVLPPRMGNLKVETSAATYMGVWLDQNRAHIIRFNGDNFHEEEILSPDIHLSDAPHSSKNTSVSPFAERRMEQRREQEKKHFYKQVLDRMSHADLILLTGPGEAKHELQKEFLRHAPLSRQLADVYTEEKMTERQLKTKVKNLLRDETLRYREEYAVRQASGGK